MTRTLGLLPGMLSESISDHFGALKRLAKRLNESSGTFLPEKVQVTLFHQDPEDGIMRTFRVLCFLTPVSAEEKAEAMQQAQKLAFSEEFILDEFVLQFFVKSLKDAEDVTSRFVLDADVKLFRDSVVAEHLVFLGEMYLKFLKPVV